MDMKEMYGEKLIKILDYYHMKDQFLKIHISLINMNPNDARYIIGVLESEVEKWKI